MVLNGEQTKKDVENLRYNYENEYKKIFNNFNQKLIDALTDVFRYYHISFNNYQLENLCSHITEMVKYYSNSSRLLNSMIDKTIKLNNTQNFENDYNVMFEEIKRESRNIPLLSEDVKREYKNTIVKSLNVNQRVMEDALNETMKRFNSLCNEISDKNYELITYFKKAIEKNLLNTINNVDNNEYINNKEINNQDMTPFGFETSKDICKDALDKLSKGSLTTSDAINIINNELNMQAPKDAANILINLQFDIPANNNEIRDFINTKLEECREMQKQNNLKQLSPIL